MTLSRRNIAALIALVVVAIFFVFSALLMHEFGSPGQTAMDNQIIENTQSETGTNNGVTSVVFDYRGFDTLGEATVLFTAVTGVIVVFRRLKK